MAGDISPVRQAHFLQETHRALRSMPAGAYRATNPTRRTGRRLVARNEHIDSQVATRERALRDDIRLVGRVLGDTIRQQQGEAVFATVERIRQISIAFRRDGDAAARRELEATLNSLSHDRTIEVVRAFSYFSHLANIAEDQHSIRCMRAQTPGRRGRAVAGGTIAKTRWRGCGRPACRAGSCRRCSIPSW